MMKQRHHRRYSLSNVLGIAKTLTYFNSSREVAKHGVPPGESHFPYADYVDRELFEKTPTRIQRMAGFTLKFVERDVVELDFRRELQATFLIKASFASIISLMILISTLILSQFSESFFAREWHDNASFGGPQTIVNALAGSTLLVLLLAAVCVSKGTAIVQHIRYKRRLSAVKRVQKEGNRSYSNKVSEHRVGNKETGFKPAPEV